jgi:lipoprotein-anchoring transpeptidase ErfK/SrfK
MTYLILDTAKGLEKLFINGKLYRNYRVNIGKVGEPTPKPAPCGRKYWKLTHAVEDHPEFGHFIYMDVPYKGKSNGPANYIEDGLLSHWEVSGPFGLHMGRISQKNIRTSSGCVRHSESDIEELYKILKLLDDWPYRYYVV